MTVKTSDGFALTILPNDHIGRHLYLTGQFDRTIVEVLLRFSQKNDRILDIGANIGYVSCALLRQVKGSRVVSVEPQPLVYELLAQNVKSIGGGRARPIRAAVSDADGRGTLVIAEGNTGASRLVSLESRNASSGSNGPSGSKTAGKEITVDLISGNELMRCSGLDRVDLIKIDVEGHEDVVLSTLTPVIERDRPRAIVFEHQGDLCSCSSSIGRRFKSLHYEIFGVRKTLTRWRLVSLADLTRSRRLSHDYLARPH